MNLNEAVTTLHSLLPSLKASDAKFAADLIASYKKWGSLTPKQEPWIARLIDRAKAPVAAAVVASPDAVNIGGFAGVIALFATAKEYLKFPKVHLVVAGTKVVLSLNGPKSKAPGFVSISGEGKYPNRAYYGRVSPEGVFSPWKNAPEFTEALTVLLTEFSSNPARVAKDHGKLTGNCCFCNKVIGDGKEQRSVLAGFGPDCAEHYGLKAEWLAAAEKAEAKASVVAPLKLEGPWLGNTNADTHGLAESLAKATGAVSVTVTDGPVVATFNADELQAELGPEYGTSEFQAKQAYDAAADQAKNEDDKAQDAASLVASKACFFCDKQAVETKTLHGFEVCLDCVAQLTAGVN